MEGVADALASFRTGSPLFGYYGSEREARGTKGYDISEVERNWNVLGRDRAEVAKGFWDFYWNSNLKSLLNPNVTYFPHQADGYFSNLLIAKIKKLV